MVADRLGRRRRGRALLARQLLLEPVDMPLGRAVEHLLGLQAQDPQAPYLQLRPRLAEFNPAELSAMVASGAVVRLALMRGTIHLVTSRDAVGLRPLVQPVIDRAFHNNHGRRLGDVDLDDVAAEAMTLVADRPRTFAELAAELGPRFPGSDPSALAQAVRARLPLVQTPPRGLWRRSGPAKHTVLVSHDGAAMTLDELVLRYLRAFGPATVADVQAWSGLTRLAEVVEALMPQLRRFTGEDGEMLLDLPRAPRPADDVPAPVRLVGPFDNLLLSHADRRHILGDVATQRVFGANGIVRGTVLVDGTVSGIWRLEHGKHAVVTITAFDHWAGADADAVDMQARQLVAWAAPEAGGTDVRTTVVVS